MYNQLLHSLSAVQGFFFNFKRSYVFQVQFHVVAPVVSVFDNEFNIAVR